jgi:hypothetical protein
MAKKHVDPLKAKAKKQKILAAVLGVAFLGLMAFQVPRIMKHMHSSPPPSISGNTSTTAAPAGTLSLAAPTLRGAQQSPATPTSDPTLAASSAAAPPPLQDGQLASFSRFASKDPFAQQLSDNKGGSSGGTSGSSGTGSKGAGATPPPVPSTQPAPGSAVISVNGKLYTVTTGTDFPQASPTDPTVVPIFHLVSVTAHSAKISIVGGSYSSGAGTVTLKEKKAVTLMNTADGTRYKIVLMPPGTDVTSAAPAAAARPTTVTLPPAAP